jgi:hypothetical protein
VDDGETAFAAYPTAIAREDTCIVQDGSLVQQDATSMHGSGKRYLVGVEEVEAGPAEHLMRSVAKDVDDGLGRIEDICIRTQVLGLGDVC